MHIPKWENLEDAGMVVLSQRGCYQAQVCILTVEMVIDNFREFPKSIEMPLHAKSIEVPLILE